MFDIQQQGSVGVTVGVGVAVGVTVGVAVGVAVGLCVGVGVAVGIGEAKTVTVLSFEYRVHCPEPLYIHTLI